VPAKRRRRPAGIARLNQARFVATLEFASTHIPRTLVVAGWLVHDCHHQIRWGLLQGETYKDITPNVTTFTRRDLQGCEDVSMYMRQGFFAFVDGEWTGNQVQLTIGTLEHPTQICLPLSSCLTDAFNSYFSESHQLFRFATMRRISALPETDANTVADITHQSLPGWMDEIPFFDGAFHQNVPAGLDHRITTKDGDYYVEGWINPPTHSNIQLSACLVGVASSVTLLQRSAFRRPDIASGEEFCGFVFIGRARSIPYRMPPILLLETNFHDTNEVCYAKINLQTVDPAKFATVFWSRVLDTHSVNPDALRPILSFTRRAAAPSHTDKPQSGAKSEPRNVGKSNNSSKEITALIIQNSDDSPLHNLAILTLRLADARFARVLMLSSSPGPAEVWWPSRDEILIVRPCTSLNEALANAGDGLMLIMEASALAKAGFISDIQTAAKMLVENGDIAGVVLIGKEFTSSQKLREHLSIQVKSAERQARLWLNMRKGSALPPVLVRAGAMRAQLKQAWPQPTHILSVRSFLKSISEELLWLETSNVEIFYSPAMAPGLSSDQADLLYQIDAHV
jgi:hypothetical protein